MKNKTTLLVIIVAFAVLIVGASVLYDRLSREQEAPDMLVTLPTRPATPTQPTDPPTQPTQPGEPTVPTEPPTEPIQPSEPTVPTEPPTEPTQPSEPAVPTNPTDPVEPPTEPTEPPTQPTEPSKPTGSAPDFVVYDANGNPVRLSDFFGKPIVLNFWASWCGPCQMEMPHFQEMYEKLGDEVVFLMVNVTGGGNDSKADALRFIQSGGYTFPVFFDLHLDAAIAYGISAFPTTYLINANGDAVAYVPGAMNAQQLENVIDMIR